MKNIMTQLAICFLLISCGSLVDSENKKQDKQFLKALPSLTFQHENDSVEIDVKFLDNTNYFEEGKLLIKQENGHISFYPIGEWITYYDNPKKIIIKDLFVRRKGLISSVGWNFNEDNVRYKSSDITRFSKNDTLFQKDIWYHPNGQIASECQYIVLKNYKINKPKHWERLVKFGEWRYYDEEGKSVKNKKY